MEGGAWLGAVTVCCAGVRTLNITGEKEDGRMGEWLLAWAPSFII